jgi:hypothetical protein
MEKMSWSDRVRNGVKEERSILYAVKRRKANWIRHILRRNWLLKHIIEENIKQYKWQEDEEEDVGSY